MSDLRNGHVTVSIKRFRPITYKLYLDINRGSIPDLTSFDGLKMENQI